MEEYKGIFTKEEIESALEKMEKEITDIPPDMKGACLREAIEKNDVCLELFLFVERDRCLYSWLLDIIDYDVNDDDVNDDMSSWIKGDYFDSKNELLTNLVEKGIVK